MSKQEELRTEIHRLTTEINRLSRELDQTMHDLGLIARAAAACEAMLAEMKRRGV